MNDLNSKIHTIFINFLLLYSSQEINIYIEFNLLSNSISSNIISHLYLVKNLIILPAFDKERVLIGKQREVASN